jgi:quercetin dioxygenase-like cupin family protein
LDVTVSQWPESEPSSESSIQSRLRREGLSAYRWSNGPGDVYSPHSHSYHKVIYVVRGSITFGLPDSGREVNLKEGDRMELPAGVTHDAVVGPNGVVCLEAHRS